MRSPRLLRAEAKVLYRSVEILNGHLQELMEIEDGLVSTAPARIARYRQAVSLLSEVAFQKQALADMEAE